MEKDAAVVVVQPNPDDPCWTPKEVAAYLKLLDAKGIPSNTQVNQLLHKDKTFPRPRKIGGRFKGRNRFEPAAVIAWFRAQPFAGEVPADTKKDGTPAKKRGRKPKAVAP